MKRPLSDLQTAVGDLEAQISDLLAQFGKEWGVSVFRISLDSHNPNGSVRIGLLAKKKQNGSDQYDF